jgi:hypothetical protein
LLVSAWVLPLDGTLAAVSTGNLYRLVSFALVSVFLICLITRLKTGRQSVRRSHRMTVSHEAAGAD